MQTLGIVCLCGSIVSGIIAGSKPTDQRFHAYLVIAVACCYLTLAALTALS